MYDRHGDRVLLHQRDGNTKINPYKWAFFGGLNEGKETFIECFKRELEEEIGYRAPDSEVFYVRDYYNDELSTHRAVFVVRAFLAEDQIVLTEGAGFKWVPFNELAGLDLTEKTKIDVDYFLENMEDIFGDATS